MKKLTLALALAFGTLAAPSAFACDCPHTKDAKATCSCAGGSSCGCKSAEAKPDNGDKKDTGKKHKKSSAG